jgi:hypothetical protein
LTRRSQAFDPAVRRPGHGEIDVDAIGRGLGPPRAVVPDDVHAPPSGQEGLGQLGQRGVELDRRDLAGRAARLLQVWRDLAARPPSLDPSRLAATTGLLDLAVDPNALARSRAWSINISTISWSGSAFPNATVNSCRVIVRVAASDSSSEVPNRKLRLI